MTDAAADPNAADQREAWNGAMGERWLAYHDQLDRMLTPMGEAAIAALASLEGRSVLDIGCGTGETTAALAEAVGVDGRARGIDISRLLIQRAQQLYGSARVEFDVADAGSDSLHGPYDAVFSRFGTMFFEDAAQAFAHIRSALVPGGRLGMVVWQAPSENEWVHVPITVAVGYVELPPPPPPGTPGPFAFADPERVRSVLEEAGFDRIDVTEHRCAMHVGEGVGRAADFLLAVLPTGPLVDRLDGEKIAALSQDLQHALEEADATGGLEGAAWIVTAHNPSPEEEP